MASGPDENGRERIVQASSPADDAEKLAGEQALGERAQELDADPDVVVEAVAKDLRPRRFQEYVGQRPVVDSISIAVIAAKKRGDTLDHALFHGPPGLGKTTIAHIIARELDSQLVHTSGPALERPADVVGLLSNLKVGDVLFIDEIHRLSHAVEEYLYSAMEDFRVDFMTGSGAFAKSINLPLQPFTLIGSTTRAGMLSAPLRERFGLAYHLDFYSIEELAQVVTRSAGILEVDIDETGAAEIARRSRGTPRISNRLLRRVRDFAEVRDAGPIDSSVASEALEIEGVDALGLDRLDRLYLTALSKNYQGGPAGIQALAATINEDQQTLEDVVEPFLLKIGFIVRTPQGRRTTSEGFEHVGLPPRLDGPTGQGTLL
ncbi:MAG TPA: Holliday junction branch migration DNA helicase RuvB [Dehalococcoidia bacterium]|nr:Holliday junction branch migration DNA helicase RuvB [Dehalococcoidia bacterium]MDP7261351.1 Holliday junction branch migration DNA helicase RuvB [Dehalococcoidia bacterium]MDP7484428.1 Holliday junction branch migration DNA helicase RuvB [Dehalococcoidia bacterium]HJP27368.1 Holliday junction branch migration DNA helicase RuvB [Dehalococcoidia bacterium]